MRKKIILLLILLLTVSSFAVNYPLNEVKAGQKGIGKTVFSGTQVEEFPIEVVGVISGQSVVSEYILIKVGGKALELGGVSEGMSGSPVYIDGKLLGAISHGFNDYDHVFGLVTPIEYMEKLLDIPKNELFIDQFDDKVTIRPLNSPLVVSGFGDRSRSFLENKLGYKLSSAAIGQKTNEHGKLEPGSTIGVEFVTGDVSLGSFGTLTNIYENERFLAYGHPILNRGTTTFLASTGFVHAVIKGQPNTYKYASLGEPIGMVSEDRKAGILGYIGKQPNMVPVKVTVKDKDLGKTTVVQAKVTQDYLLLPRLTASTVLEGFDRGLDRVGPGTSRVKFTIKGDGLPYTLERENRYYTYADVAALSLSEIGEIMDLLIYNDYYNVQIKEIDVEAEFSELRETAVITSTTPNVTVVSAGDEVEIVVQIRPFRGEAESVKLTLPIPEKINPGKVHVVIRPGTSIPSYEVKSDPAEVTSKFELQSDERVSAPISQEAKDWEKVLKEFLNREKNNEIVVEFYPPYIDSFDDTEGENDISLPVQVRYETVYVIEGDRAFDLEIVSDSEL